MPYLAIGDALVRLCRGNKIAIILRLIEERRHSMLIDGAFRAMAMLRLVPSEEEMSRILDYAASLSVNDGNRFWIVAACPGWPASTTERFLEDTANSTRTDVHEAILLAQSGKYKVWHPL